MATDRRVTVALGLVAVVASAALAGCSSGSGRQAFEEGPCGGSGVAGTVRSSLLDGDVGVGIADYPGFPVADIPKGSGAFLMGEVICADVSDAYDRSVMDELGALVLAWPTTYPSEHFGWGLPFEWDAFGDGTTNPANTVYSISTGVSVKALLDWAAISDDATRDEVYRVVDDALAEWVAPESISVSGQLRYSLSGLDDGYDVFNSSAMLAGQMQRFAELGVSDRSSSYEEVADRVMRSLIDHHVQDPQANWYWNYSTVEDVPNDLTHAGYIVDGIVTYVESGGAFSSDLPLEEVVGHLLMFRSDGTVPEPMLPWPVFWSDNLERPRDRVLRLYEAGWTLFMVSQHRDLLSDLVTPICEQSRRHRDEADLYHKYPLDIEVPIDENPVIYEYVAYFYLGLVSLGGDTCEA